MFVVNSGIEMFCFLDVIYDVVCCLILEDEMLWLLSMLL